jgi:hypothetical protein
MCEFSEQDLMIWTAAVVVDGDRDGDGGTGGDGNDENNEKW